MPSWDGDERRKDKSYHDLLIRIDANLSNLIEDFKQHKRDDNEKFDGIDVAFRGVDNRVKRVEEKIMWYSGALAVCMFIFNWIFMR